MLRAMPTLSLNTPWYISQEVNQFIDAMIGVSSDEQFILEKGDVAIGAAPTIKKETQMSQKDRARKRRAKTIAIAQSRAAERKNSRRRACELPAGRFKKKKPFSGFGRIDTRNAHIGREESILKTRMDDAIRAELRDYRSQNHPTISESMDSSSIELDILFNSIMYTMDEITKLQSQMEQLDLYSLEDEYLAEFIPDEIEWHIKQIESLLPEYQILFDLNNKGTFTLSE